MFNIIPVMHENNVAVQFLNYYGKIVTTRLIYNSYIRYIIPKDKQFYYFQNFIDIDEYDNIVITEGAFDLINLYNYQPLFNNKTSFYLSLSGNNYKGLVTELINTYLLIGRYNIHVVLDNGLKFLDQMTRSMNIIVNELNPEIKLNFYLPTHTKDVSECMSLTQL
jgi:hypothetical protein